MSRAAASVNAGLAGGRPAAALALASILVSLGCPGVPPTATAEVTGDSTTPTTSSTSHGSGGSTGLPSTSGGVDSTTTSTTSTTGSVATSETSSGSTSFGSTGGGSTDEMTGPVPPSPCMAGCAVEFACGRMWRSERACVDACEANLIRAARFERACAAAWEDLHECLGTLSCEEFTVWLDPMRFPYPCLSEDEVLAFECAGQ